MDVKISCLCQRHAGIGRSRCTAPLVLTSTLNGSDWLISRAGHFTVGEDSRCSLNRRISGLQSYSELFAREKNLLPLTRFEQRTVHPVINMENVFNTY